MPGPVDPNEDCGGCVTRKGKAGLNWHRRRRQEACEHAREEANRYNRQQWARKQAQEGWVPGTSILVPELDPL